MKHNKQSIIKAIKEQKYGYAEILCWELLKIDGNSSDIQLFLAVSLLAQKKYKGAIDAYKKILSFQNNNFDVLNNLGYAYRHTGDIENATKYLNMADDLRPNTFSVKVNKAHIAFSLRNFKLAKQLLVDCIASVKDVVGEEALYPARSLLVEAELAQNEISSAISLLNSYQENKFNGRFFFDKANIEPSSLSKSDLINASNSLSNPGIGVIEKASVLFGLGRHSEFTKNYDLAFNHYLQGNQIKADLLRFRPYFRQNQIKKLFKIFNSTMSKSIYQELGDSHLNKGKGCIFIVGMPRSGTTLTESIFCSLDNIVTAGEQNYMSSLAEYYCGEEWEQINSEKVETIGDEYLRLIKPYTITGKNNYIIDKMPSNIYNVGLIKLCLPAAKIICLDRSAQDNAWSVFTQLYLENIPFSSNLFNLGLESSNVKVLIKFWETTLSRDDFYKIRYEDLASNPEEFSQKLFNIIGVKASYDSEKRKKFYSRTASKVQVQKDVYTSSIKRSKYFDKYLGPFVKSYEDQNDYWDQFYNKKL